LLPRSPLIAALALAAATGGCGPAERSGPAAAPAAPTGALAQGPSAANAAPRAPAASAPPAKAAMRFEECAEKAGLDFRMSFLPDEQGEHFKINLYDHGCGVAIADVDGDGLDDVFFCNQLGPCRLYRNVGGGKFVDMTKDAGDLASALDGRICVAAAFADVDGDGREDLYVTTTRGGNVFFHNEGGGKFRIATKEAGLTLVRDSETPVFFDMDGDGAIDLLVTNTARWTLDDYDEKQKYYRGKQSLWDLVASEREPDVLYRNDGKGHFTDVTAESGLAGRGWSGDVAVFDADGDGHPDLFIGNMFGGSALYLNDGKGHFRDVTRTALGKTSWGAVGARAFDFDGDGLLDLFVVDMHSDMWSPPDMRPNFVDEHRRYPDFFGRAIQLGFVTAKDDAKFTSTLQIKKDEIVFGNTLYRNLGGGRFEEVSQRANAETFWPWGVAEGDFDCDGFVDAFIPSGMGYPYFYWRSSLLHNRGDGTFEDVCTTAGTEPPPGGRETAELVAPGRHEVRSSRGAATADFDGSGRLDIVVNNFNDRAFLWHNVTPPRHWCELRLVGTKSNRDAVGAVVRLIAGGRTQIRQVQAAGGYLSQSSNVVHFGLGDASEIDSVDITWPSGVHQHLTTPRVDTRSTVTESEK
jgi:hypothetical protein